MLHPECCVCLQGQIQGPTPALAPEVERELERCLKDQFGINRGFRVNQREAIRASMSGFVSPSFVFPCHCLCHLKIVLD